MDKKKFAKNQFPELPRPVALKIFWYSALFRFSQGAKLAHLGHVLIPPPNALFKVTTYFLRSLTLE